MSSRLIPLVLIAFVLGAIIGCTPTRTYEVMVINDGDAPIVAWMSKQGTPVEMNWLSPGQTAILFDPSQIKRMELPQVEIPPGGRATFGPREGKFSKGSYGVVDLFAAPMSFEEMISLSSRSQRWERFPVPPGQSVLRVTSADPVEVERVALP